jgi:hypothetical protein
MAHVEVVTSATAASRSLGQKRAVGPSKSLRRRHFTTSLIEPVRAPTETKRPWGISATGVEHRDLSLISASHIKGAVHDTQFGAASARKRELRNVSPEIPASTSQRGFGCPRD